MGDKYGNGRGHGEFLGLQGYGDNYGDPAITGFMGMGLEMEKAIVGGWTSTEMRKCGMDIDKRYLK